MKKPRGGFKSLVLPSVEPFVAVDNDCKSFFIAIAILHMAWVFGLLLEATHWNSAPQKDQCNIYNRTLCINRQLKVVKYYHKDLHLRCGKGL